MIYLGVRMMMAPPVAEVSVQPSTRVFWDSALLEVLNPKTALFFLAFLPRFTDLDASLPVWAQLLILGTLVNLVFSSADILCVLLADRIRRGLSGKDNRWVKIIGGLVLVLLGLNFVAEVW